MKKFTCIVLLIISLSYVRLSAQDTMEVMPAVNSKWGFGLNGGFGYRAFRAGKIATAERSNYIKDFKSGLAFGGEVTYFPWEKVGFGVKYDRYQSKADQEGKLAEDVAIQFLGGEVIHRKVLKNPKSAILTSFLLGYQPYRNQTTVGEQQFTFNGKTMGWGLSVGYEYRISQKFAMHLTGSALMGAVYRLDRTTAISKATLHLSKDDSVDLSRFAIQLGFRFY